MKTTTLSRYVWLSDEVEPMLVADQLRAEGGGLKPAGKVWLYPNPMANKGIVRLLAGGKEEKWKMTITLERVEK